MTTFSKKDWVEKLDNCSRISVCHSLLGEKADGPLYCSLFASSHRRMFCGQGIEMNRIVTKKCRDTGSN
jgi:hypothetical protein